jgi:hypothetical protein
MAEPPNQITGANAGGTPNNGMHATADTKRH